MQYGLLDRSDYTHSAVYDAPAPIKYSMRDGNPISVDSIPAISFAQFPHQFWRKDNWVEPRTRGTIIPVLGSGVPLKSEEMCIKKPKESLLPFHWNPVSPECCPSTLSTSTGCVCTSNRQRNYLNMMRYGNKTWPDDSV